MTKEDDIDIRLNGRTQQATEAKVVVRKDVTDAFGRFFGLSAKQAEKVAILDAKPSSGLSFFLETLAFQFSDSESIFLVVSTYDKSPNSALNQIFAQLLSDPKQKKHFRDFLTKQKGPGQTQNLLRSLAVCIPVIGPAFGVIEHKAHKHVDEIQNDIHVLNLGADYIAEISKDCSMVICIDAGDDFDFTITNFVERFSTGVFKHVKFVIGLTSPNAREVSQKLSVLLETTGITTRQITFPKPQTQFVLDIYTANNLMISKANAERISRKSDGSIYNILYGMNALMKSKGIGDVIFSELDHRPSLVEKKLIGFLAVAEQDLPENELIELLSQSSDIFVEDAYQVREKIDHLQQIGILEVYDHTYERLISLRKKMNSTMVAGKDSKIDYLLISQQLYDFYVKRQGNGKSLSALKYAPLLYRLSGVCDVKRRPEYGRAVLRYSVLLQNFAQVESCISSISTQGDEGDFGNFLLAVTYQVSIKDYAKALELITNSKWRDTHPAMLLEGICNNRLRSHERADILLKMVIKNVTSMEEAVIVNAYLVANYLHWGKIEEARDHYRVSSQECEGASNFGYLIRNAAAAFDQENKFKMECEAAQIFKSVQNHYGQHSSLINAGATLMASRQFERAAQMYEGSRRELEKYGVQNSVIVMFNQMALSTFQKDLDTASTLMQRFKRLPDHNIGMTEMYTLFYDAALALLKNDPEAADKNVRELEHCIDASNLVRAKDRLYSSAAALSMACNAGDSSFTQSLLSKAKHWPDKRDPNTTQRVVGFGETWLENPEIIDMDQAFDLIFPPYFAYWYMDEISLLSRAWFTS